MVAECEPQPECQPVAGERQDHCKCEPDPRCMFCRVQCKQGSEGRKQIAASDNQGDSVTLTAGTMAPPLIGKISDGVD